MVEEEEEQEADDLVELNDEERRTLGMKLIIFEEVETSVQSSWKYIRLI